MNHQIPDLEITDDLTEAELRLDDGVRVILTRIDTSDTFDVTCVRKGRRCSGTFDHTPNSVRPPLKTIINILVTDLLSH